LELRVRRFALLKGGEDLAHKCPGRLGRKLHRHTLSCPIRMAYEINRQRMVEGCVVGMIEVNIGGIDAHPSSCALGAAEDLRLVRDVGAHRSPPMLRDACCRTRSPWPSHRRLARADKRRARR